MKKRLSCFSSLLTLLFLSISSLSLAATETTSIRDWQIICGTQENVQEKRCLARHAVTNDEGGVIGVFTAVRKPNDGQLMMEIVVPLMLDLEAQALLQIDDQPAVKKGFKFCSKSGCHLLLEGDDLFEKLKQGGDLKVGVTPLRNQITQITFSLRGLSAALQSL